MKPVNVVVGKSELEYRLRRQHERYLQEDLEHDSFTSSHCKSENEEKFWLKKNNKVEHVDFVAPENNDPFNNQNIKEVYHTMDIICKAAEGMNKEIKKEPEVMQSRNLFSFSKKKEESKFPLL